MKYTAILLFIGFFAGLFFAETSTWNFTNANDYNYNSSSIIVTGGTAKLLGEVTTTVGWWHMNEVAGSNVSDSSGYGNNGTATGTTIVAGKLNNARSFNGVNSSINFGNSSSLTLNHATLEVWIKPSVVTLSRIISKYGSVATNRNYQMFTYANGALYSAMTDSAGADQAATQTAAGTIVAGNWYYIVYTYDGTYGRLYINSVLNVTSSAWSGTVGTAATQPLYLGTYSTGGTALFNGTMDEVAVYNKSINLAEITYRYNFGNGTESPLPAIGNYSTLNPTIDPNAPLNSTILIISNWTGFVETSTKPNGTEIRYILSNDNVTWKYWNGAAWAISNQLYAQSSNSSAVNTNIATFPKTNNYLIWRSFFNSDGNSTPVLDNLNISYLYWTPPPIIALIEPINLSKTLSTPTFIFNATSGFPSLNCNLEITKLAPVVFKNGIIASNSITYWTISDTFITGNYTWRIYCQDIINQNGTSSYRTFSIGTPQTITNMTNTYQDISTPLIDIKILLGLFITLLGIWGIFHYATSMIRI